MSIATMTDRALPLAERVQAALLCWDMDDAHEAARAELIADVAAADRLARATAWRDASREPPPEGVPVWMMDGDGTVSIFETFLDDDGAVCWAVCEYAPWWTGLALNPVWHSVNTDYEGDRVARYWHPLPTVPTLAELDAAQGVGDA